MNRTEVITGRMMVVAPVSKTVLLSGSGELVRGLTTACRGLSSSSDGLDIYSIKSNLLAGSGDSKRCSKLQPLSELVSDKGRSMPPP